MKKSKLQALIGSIISCIIVFLLLWFIIMPGIVEPEDEGIMISFGDSDNGSGTGGSNEAQAAIPDEPVITPSQPVASQPVQVRPTPQDYITQTDPSAVSIAEQKEKDRKRKEQEAIMEEQRRRQEEDRRIAEQKRKEQEAIDRANSLIGGSIGGSGNQGGGNGTQGTGGGSGNTTGDSRQGNPVGQGSAGGNSWSLDGRSLTGQLISPSYNRNVEGRVTVAIRVNEAGQVIAASIASNTTISDAETRNAAIEAAKKTKFSQGQGISTGTITYNFKLR